MTNNTLINALAILCGFFASPLVLGQQFEEFTQEPSLQQSPAPAQAPSILPSSEDLRSTELDAANDTSWRSYVPKNQDSVEGIEVTKDVVVADIVAPSTDYTYASFGKPSPFVPPLLANHFAKLEIPIVSILQRYKLSELTLVGVWTLENSARKALIMTQENEGVTVQVGDHIGNRGGKIIRIGPNSIKVREFNLAPDGSRQFDDRDLHLGNEEDVNNSKIVIKSNTGTGGKDLGRGERQDFLDTTNWQEQRNNRIQKSVPPLADPAPSNQSGLPKGDTKAFPEITKPASLNLNKNPSLIPVRKNQAYHPASIKNNSMRGTTF